MRRFFIFFFVFNLIFVYKCFAHKISAFLDVEGKQVTVYSYFSDGTPVKNGKVEVYDEKGKLILTGKTDANGTFIFTVPKQGDYKVVVIAGLGHVAKAFLHKNDFYEEKDEEIAEEETKIEAENQEKIITLSEEQIRKIVKEELKKELHPIRQTLREIKEQQSRVTLKDVFSGLGWILGIFGAMALIYARKSSK